MPKSMIFGLGLPVDERDQDVRGLEVPVDDRLLVRVLDALADLDEELEPLLGVERCWVSQCSVIGTPGTYSMTKYGRPSGVLPAVEHLGDGGVVHQGQGLPLGLEAGHHLLGVHARLDDLERHPAPDRLELLGEPDLAHPALAEDLEKPVRADASGPVALTFGGDGGLQGNGILETRCRPVWIAGHRPSETPSGDRSQRRETSPSTGTATPLQRASAGGGSEVRASSRAVSSRSTA